MTEKKTDEKLSFAERLGQVQLMLKAPKSRMNDFGGYSYRSTEDILEAVKPLLLEYRLLLVISDDIVLIGDRYYIRATATINDMDSDVQISTQAYAREAFEKKKSDDAQITGAASSYARKYALNGLLLIDDTKDPDTNEYTRQNNASESQAKNNASRQQKADTEAHTADNEPITADDVKRLEGMLAPNQLNWVLTHCGVKELSQLTKKQYTEVINGLKRNAEAKSKA